MNNELLSFVKNLSCANETSKVMALVYSFIDSCSPNIEQLDDETKSKLYELISGYQAGLYTSFANNLGFCRKHCIDEQNTEAAKNDKEYFAKLTTASSLFAGISSVYQQVNDERLAAAPENNIDQQKIVLFELNEKVKKLIIDTESAKKEIENATNSFDEKINNLLTNSVSILGIFVAIAFVGIGVTTIFSSIDLATAVRSNEAFLKNIAYLLLTAFFSYNLLLLLFYFIFKLSRPTIKIRAENIPFRFVNTIKFKPFIIDIVLGVLALLTILLSVFVWSSPCDTCSAFVSNSDCVVHRLISGTDYIA